MQASDILFRCSGLGYLMTEPQGKSNFQKWEDACVNWALYVEQYANMKNKETATAQKKKYSN